MQITVVGAGVIGLTTALTLEEAGHDVQVVADATGAAITSDVAGAVWFPYRCGPAAKVSLWASITRVWLERFASDHDAGIDLLTGYEITSDVGFDPPRPWWASNIDVERQPAPVRDSPVAWTFRAPRVEPRRFVPWITARLRRPIEHRRVADLAAEPGDLVIDCAGLGARELAADPELVPLFGQIVITEPGSVDLGITVTDHRDPDTLFYVIPRRDELVLGGCSIPWQPGAPIPADDAITDRILRHARSLDLDVGPVKRIRTGLRPFRVEVRLEREGRIIHNYGHGGAGYTLCRGCAEDVRKLVDAIAARPG